MIELDMPVLATLRRLQLELSAWDKCLVLASRDGRSGKVYSNISARLPDIELPRSSSDTSAMVLMHIPGVRAPAERISELLSGLVAADGAPADLKLGECLPSEALSRFIGVAGVNGTAAMGRQLMPYGATGTLRVPSRVAALVYEDSEFYTWAHRLMMASYGQPMIVVAFLDYKASPGSDLAAGRFIGSSRICVMHALDKNAPDGVDVFDDLFKSLLQAVKFAGATIALGRLNYYGLFGDIITSLPGFLSGQWITTAAYKDIAASGPYNLRRICERIASPEGQPEDSRVDKWIKLLLKPSFEANPEMKRFWTEYSEQETGS